MKTNRNLEVRMDEARLVSFARSYLAASFPNPERIGCPPPEMLRRLAEQPRSGDLSITEHLGGCSPCFQQYQELLAKTRRNPLQSRILSIVLVSRPKLVALVGVIGFAVIALSVALWLSYKRQIVHQAPSQPIINSTNDDRNLVTELSPFILDMSKASQIRGKSRQNGLALKIPRKPMHIFIYLPIGSDSGEYRVLLNKGKEPVWSGRGIAKMRDKRMVMELEDGLSLYEPGPYTLTLLSKSGLRLTQGIILEDRAQAN
jgi:hypothetical protein